MCVRARARACVAIERHERINILNEPVHYTWAGPTMIWSTQNIEGNPTNVTD